MRDATTLAATVLAATIVAAAAPAANVVVTAPLLQRPADVASTAQTKPQGPWYVRLQSTPEAAGPGPTKPPPEPNYLHREPDSEEWHCLVPLQRIDLPPTVPAIPNRCQDPSINPGNLLHLL